ncbi:MAG: hypothetical protein ACKVQT_35030 [Burkholderiales bacterium]
MPLGPVLRHRISPNHGNWPAVVDQALRDDRPQFIAARTDARLPAGVMERDAAKIRVAAWKVEESAHNAARIPE